MEVGLCIVTVLTAVCDCFGTRRVKFGLIKSAATSVVTCCKITFLLVLCAGLSFLSGKRWAAPWGVMYQCGDIHVRLNAQNNLPCTYWPS